jgi:hypothetical protein
MATATPTIPSNDEFYKCQRCRKVVIAAEFDCHSCSPKITDHKNIEFDYYVITKDALGRERLLVKTMDGTLYSLIKREKKESDKMPLLQARNGIYKMRYYTLSQLSQK